MSSDKLTIHLAQIVSVILRPHLLHGNLALVLQVAAAVLENPDPVVLLSLGHVRLQTALDLQNEKQWARITTVMERRPLSDPFTAIRGSTFSAKAANGQPVRAEGIDAIRQGLLVEMASIAAAATRIEASHDNIEAQAKAVTDEKQQLDSDLTSWGKDVTAATETAAAFDDRLRAATIELSALENSIVRLGKELTASWATLTATADAAAR